MKKGLHNYIVYFIEYKIMLYHFPIEPTYDTFVVFKLRAEFY